MKKLILLLPIFIGTMATAQNWSLVMPNDTLVYEKQDNHQFFTVWVDSTHVNGTDTTYYFNNIFPGNQIPNDSSNFCLNDNEYNKYQGIQKLERSRLHFCGTKITVSGAKSSIWYDSIQFVIYPNNPVGSTWVSNSSSTTSLMKILSQDTMKINALNVVDSVKTFYYNGKIMTLSKNHGIVLGTDLRANNNEQFKLTGIQNQNLGTHIPMFKDIFDFEVGDVFFRRNSYLSSDGDTRYKYNAKIILKTISSDSLIYKVRIIKQHYETTSYEFWKFWPTMNPLLNALPNTITTSKSMVFLGHTSKSIVRVDRENKRVIKSNDYHTGVCDYQYSQPPYLISYSPFGPYQRFQEGVGIVYESEVYLGGSFVDELIGYHKINGEFWGDTTYTGVYELNYSNLINIYPNPTNNIINITTEKLNSISILEMYDLQGRIIITKNFESELTLDISEWSSGVYFAIIKDTDGAVLHREKVVIQ